MDTLNNITESRLHAYLGLLTECGITDERERQQLLLFVTEDCELDSNLEAKLNEDLRLQEFVERAFQIEFTPLQELVSKSCEQ